MIDSKLLFLSFMYNVVTLYFNSILWTQVCYTFCNWCGFVAISDAEGQYHMLPDVEIDLSSVSHKYD